MNTIIFIGLQASGKSSFFFEYFYKTHIRLNMDMLNTRNRERILIDACLEAKQPFVLDNTNPSKSDRSEYILKSKEHKFEVIGYYFRSNIKECLERNATRTGKEFIPEVGILGTHKRLELPLLSEGFNKLYHVSIVDGEFIIKEWEYEV